MSNTLNGIRETLEAYGAGPQIVNDIMEDVRKLEKELAELRELNTAQETPHDGIREWHKEWFGGLDG